jgi:hypothetical protein
MGRRLWWAYEYKQTDAVEILLAAGVDPEAKDSVSEQLAVDP